MTRTGALEDSAETWRVGEVAPRERADFWREVVSATHLPWTLRAGADPDPQARVARRRLGDIDLLDCWAGPCTGWRSRRDLARTPGEFVGVLVVRRGVEVIEQHGHEVVVTPGEVVTWTSREPLSFQVLAPLHKHTLLVPMSRYQDAGRRDDTPDIHVVAASPARRLLVSYLAMLSTAPLAPAAGIAGGTAALALLGAALAGGRREPAALGRAELLAAARLYIEEHLAEASLSPRQVAHALAVSERTLYAAFEADEDTVQGGIRRARLTRAHGQLLRDGSDTVAEVGRRCGFPDPAHFSRAFRARYGYPPSALRGR